MYFYKRQGKQILDLSGNLILTHTDTLIKTCSKSSGPFKVIKARYIKDIPSMGVWSKIKTTLIVLSFIWGKIQPGPIEEFEAFGENILNINRNVGKNDATTKNKRMRPIDKYIVIFMVMGLSLFGYAHFDAQSQCLASKKPKTDSTGPAFVSPFTGEYKRLGGILFCRDSRGTLHAYQAEKVNQR